MAIKSVNFRKILDSRGNYSVECEVYSGPCFSRCSAPSGASVGKYEAVAYPKGAKMDDVVALAASEIAPKLVGMDESDQKSIDAALKQVDGTGNFSRIGGNVAMAVSIACAKLAATLKGVQLYEYLGDGRALSLPLSKMIGGGKHALNSCDVQEFLSVPLGAKRIYQALEANIAVHRKVAEVLVKKTGLAVGRDDESGWVAKLKTEDALEILASACEEVGKEKGVEVRAGMDMAASSMFENGSYAYKLDGRKLSKGEQIDFAAELIRKFRLAYVEDALQEEDFEGFAELTRKAKGCLICGDDIFVTNRRRLEQGVKMKACNSIIIKPNQMGTMTDLEETIRYAKASGYTMVASHRSGETCDDYLAHIAVAYGCKMTKTNVIGGERNAKFNEMARIFEKEGKWI